MIVGSIKEDLSFEKRISLTPETAKNIIGLGLKVHIEKNYAQHLGVQDGEYSKVGVEIKNSANDILNNCNLLIKVNLPKDSEISSLKEKTIIIGMLNPAKNKNAINEILKKKDKYFFTRIITSYYKSPINGCAIITIKFSWLQSCS